MAAHLLTPNPQTGPQSAKSSILPLHFWGVPQPWKRVLGSHRTSSHEPIPRGKISDQEGFHWLNEGKVAHCV